MLHVLLCSVCFRVLLVLLGAYEWLGERVEVATPINSWSRRELSVNKSVRIHVQLMFCTQLKKAWP